MAETGRAAVFQGVGKPFHLREYPVPDPGPNDMVVRIVRTNICGSDLHLWRGDTDLARVGLTYDMILGHEMTGVVHKAGARVRSDALGRRLKEGHSVVFTYYNPCSHCRPCLVGDPHMCMASVATPVRPCDMPPHFVGGFADFYYVKGRQSVFRVPGPVGPEIAAGANCALSQVLYGLEVGRLRLGEAVVVQGAGGLGLYACAVAREMGAGLVIAIDGVPERLELARAFGAHEVIDINDLTDPRERVSRVQDLTGGLGADVVVEVVGIPEVVNEGIRMLTRGGRYLELGNINPRHTYKADPSLLVGFNRSILGVSLYPPRVLEEAMSFLARTQDRYPYQKLVSHDYPLEEIDRAFSEADAFAGGSVVRASVVPA